MQSDYQKGDKAVYSEWGEIYGVEVVKSGCNKRWEKYDLKVLEVVTSLIERKVGAEFYVEKRRDTACSGDIWHLSED